MADEARKGSEFTVSKKGWLEFLNLKSVRLFENCQNARSRSLTLFGLFVYRQHEVVRNCCYQGARWIESDRHERISYVALFSLFEFVTVAIALCTIWHCGIAEIGKFESVII